MRGFRFQSILYSERCAHICPLKIQLFGGQTFMLEPTLNLFFSLRVHGWIQTTVSQLAGVRGCRRKRQSSLIQWDVGCLYTDVAKTSISNFRRVGTAFSGNSHKPFCSSAATLARFFHVEIFWLVDESSTKFTRHIACCTWSAVQWVICQV